jgi:molybdate transport system substrate-binding protein
MTKTGIGLLAALLALGVALSAADLSVMSAGAAEAGLTKVVDQYKRTSGNDLKIVYNTGPELAQRLAAGDAADVLIAPIAVVDQAQKDGRVVAATRLVLGRVGVGVVVRSGRPTPTIATAESLKQALMKADSIVYGQGSTGVYVQKLLGDMGLADVMKTKGVRVVTGRDVVERILSGKGDDIGLAAISEIKLLDDRGATLVGPLPASIQNYTTYAAIVMTGAKTPEVARDFLRVLAAPASTTIFRSSGVE